MSPAHASAEVHTERKDSPPSVRARTQTPCILVPCGNLHMHKPLFVVCCCCGFRVANVLLLLLSLSVAATLSTGTPLPPPRPPISSVPLFHSSPAAMYLTFYSDIKVAAASPPQPQLSMSQTQQRFLPPSGKGLWPFSKQTQKTSYTKAYYMSVQQLGILFYFRKVKAKGGNQQNEENGRDRYFLHPVSRNCTAYIAQKRSSRSPIIVVK